MIKTQFVRIMNGVDEEAYDFAVDAFNKYV